MNTKEQLLIKNALVWRGPGYGIDEGDEIAIQDGFFIKPSDLDGNSPCETYNAAQLLLMPGLVNVHAHLYSSLARGMPGPADPPMAFSEILEYVWWRLDKALDEESIRLSALVGGIEAIKSGVTSIFDHHASPHAVEGSLSLIGEAMSILGLRADLCYEVSDRDGTEIARKGIAENVDWIKKTKNLNHRMLAGHFGMHALFTITKETLQIIKNQLESLNAGIHLHLAEGIEDVRECYEKFNLSPIERLKYSELFKPESLLIHGVHLTSVDFEELSLHPVTLVHNPQSNLNNAVGMLDLVSAHKAGVQLGLGNDGIGGAIISELRAAIFAGHHNYQDPNSPSYSIPFEMLTETNPKVASTAFRTKLGRIEPGYAADFILVDYNPPTPWTDLNSMGHFVFGLCDRFSVRHSWIAGHQVLNNGQITGLDENDVYRCSRIAAQQLWERMSQII